MLKRFVIGLVSTSLLMLGFAQSSSAAVVGTYEVLERQARGVQIDRMEQLLATAEVQAQLEKHGVAPEVVLERLAHMTHDEIAALADGIDEQLVGGDALAVIGVVFIVLLILELVGVIDIFKAT